MNIKEGQKLSQYDCIYGLNREQIEELCNISGEVWFVQPGFSGLVFCDGELYPTELEYCTELEEYEFEEYRQLCINTFSK